MTISGSRVVYVVTSVNMGKMLHELLVTGRAAFDHL